MGWGGGAIVIGNKRSLGKYDSNRFNMFWNTDTKDIYVFAGVISKKWWNERNNISTSSTRTYRYLPAFYKYNFVTNPDIRSRYYADPAGIYNNSPWRISRRAPLIGEHNEEIYCGELALGKTELAYLAEAGVV